MTTGPNWITNAGTLLTANELFPTSTTVLALGTNVSYKLISGSLPTGMTISSTGTISGTPSAVIEPTDFKFVIRASAQEGVSDRTFAIRIIGSQSPTWSTSSGFTNLLDYNTGTAYLKLGPLGENFALNKQYVNYQFQATATLAPDNAKVSYYIPDNGGKLPPGLTLSSDGILSGFMNDSLIFDAIPSDTGGYDEEAYDKFSYDFGTVAVDSIGVPKIYQFKVRASDGIGTADRIFKILVISPEMIRTPQNIQMTLEPGLITSNSNYIPIPQFVSGNDLGTIRAENNHIIPITAYDGYPLLGDVQYTISTSTVVGRSLPNFLNLDIDNGTIFGYVPYQPAYTQRYSITIDATKFYSGARVTATNTFTLAIQGDVDSSIEWVSSSTLGTIYEGYTSELAVEARQLNSEYTVKYSQIGGNLPPGLTLERDGSLSGSVTYGNTGTYTFSVRAQDVYGLSAIDRTFSVDVKNLDNKTYTKMWVRPFLPLEKRNVFRDFMLDPFVFPQESMYRFFDTNFGVQTEIKMYLEFAIQEQNLAEYVPALRENFYRKSFYFGDVKLAIAKDKNGVNVYEVVYVDVIDKDIQTQGTTPGSVDRVIYSNNKIYYPNSIDNMKYQLQHLTLNANDLITVDEFNMPLFMRTAQADDYKPAGYMHVIPLCYTLPGEGKKIMSRIKLREFDFKQFHMDIDRLILEKTLDYSTAKYLLFPRQDITDVIESDNILYAFDETPIITDTNNIITRE